MSVSTDGIIFCGWLLDDDIELPWGDDLNRWWRRVSGFQECELYDKRGEYLPGVSKSTVDDYYNRIREWDKENPKPFELVIHCSDSFPNFAIVLPGTVRTASRGYPEVIDPEKMDISFDGVTAIKEILRQHGINLVGDPGWYLASYWG